MRSGLAEPIAVAVEPAGGIEPSGAPDRHRAGIRGGSIECGLPMVGSDGEDLIPTGEASAGEGEAIAGLD